VRIVNVGLLNLYQSRGTFGHAAADIRGRVTKRLEEGRGHVGFYEQMGFYNTRFSKFVWKAKAPLGALAFIKCRRACGLYPTPLVPRALPALTSRGLRAPREGAEGCR